MPPTGTIFFVCWIMAEVVAGLPNRVKAVDKRELPVVIPPKRCWADKAQPAPQSARITTMPMGIRVEECFMLCSYMSNCVAVQRVGFACTFYNSPSLTDSPGPADGDWYANIKCDTLPMPPPITTTSTMASRDPKDIIYFLPGHQCLGKKLDGGLAQFSLSQDIMDAGRPKTVEDCVNFCFLWANCSAVIFEAGKQCRAFHRNIAEKPGFNEESSGHPTNARLIYDICCDDENCALGKPIPTPIPQLDIKGKGRVRPPKPVIEGLEEEGEEEETEEPEETEGTKTVSTATATPESSSEALPLELEVADDEEEAEPSGIVKVVETPKNAIKGPSTADVSPGMAKPSVTQQKAKPQEPEVVMIQPPSVPAITFEVAIPSTEVNPPTSTSPQDLIGPPSAKPLVSTVSKTGCFQCTYNSTTDPNDVRLDTKVSPQLYLPDSSSLECAMACYFRKPQCLAIAIQRVQCLLLLGDQAGVTPDQLFKNATPFFGFNIKCESK